MAYIDAHFHVWDLDRFQYPWPTKEIPALFRNFTIEELEEDQKITPVKHAVFVQVLNNKPEEIKWITELGKKHSVIKGIIGGLDLTSPNLPEILDEMCKNTLFKGCRHILDFEEETWITCEDVFQGLKQLEDRNLTYDLLLRLKFVIDHIAKPYVKDGKLSPWREEMAAIAEFPNVYVKISGLVNEGDLENWKKEDFQQYVDHIVNVFGIDRCMFGSDWPVCYQAGCKYEDVYRLLNDLLPSLSEEDNNKLFRENAKSFYSLDV